MKTQFYLVVNSRGTVRVANKKMPSIAADEIVISTTLDLPGSLFTKPRLSAEIVVTEEMTAPTVITPELQNNIKNAIEGASGLQVTLTIDGLSKSDEQV